MRAPCEHNVWKGKRGMLPISGMFQSTNALALLHWRRSTNYQGKNLVTPKLKKKVMRVSSQNLVLGCAFVVVKQRWRSHHIILPW